MLNFTVGPVQMEDYLCCLGAEQIPYFRTEEFSEMMKESESMLLELIGAPMNSRAVFVTGSGTASMESAVMNVLNGSDRAIVINGGSFGNRFSELCDIHGIEHSDIMLEAGETLKMSHLLNVDADQYSTLLINVHETSTGVLYDIDMVGKFCKEHNLLLIADVISTFLADSLDMAASGINVAIASSQKALACPPGVSMVVMDDTALKRVEKNETKCMYLDLKDALKNGERGQTPFTPAVGVLRQLHARLGSIKKAGGAGVVIARTEEIAKDFRNRIKGMPFTVFPETQSNAVTVLEVKRKNAKMIFDILKKEYNIWICPNGGSLGDRIFRVGHIGDISIEDNTKLIQAFSELKERNVI